MLPSRPEFDGAPVKQRRVALSSEGKSDGDKNHHPEHHRRDHFGEMERDPGGTSRRAVVRMLPTCGLAARGRHTPDPTWAIIAWAAVVSSDTGNDSFIRAGCPRYIAMPLRTASEHRAERHALRPAFARVLNPYSSLTGDIPRHLAHPTRGWCNRLAALERDIFSVGEALGGQGLIHAGEHDEAGGECKRRNAPDRPRHAQ